MAILVVEAGGHVELNRCIGIVVTVLLEFQFRSCCPVCFIVHVGPNHHNSSFVGILGPIVTQYIIPEDDIPGVIRKLVIPLPHSRSQLETRRIIKGVILKHLVHLVSDSSKVPAADSGAFYNEIVMEMCISRP